MTLTLTCLAVLGVTLCLPLALGRRRTPSPHPGRVLALWTGSVLLGAASLVVAAGAVLVPVPLWQRSGCEGCASVVTFVVCSASAVALGGVVALLAASAEREWRRNERLRAGMTLLLSHPSTGTASVRGRTVHLTDRTCVRAASVRLAGEAVIVLDRSFASRLSPAALGAVVEHEAAHLDLGHDRVRWLVRLVHGAFPWLPGAASCARLVELSVEAAADDRAAAVVGEQALLLALGQAA